jgi:hypothetical protein
MAQKIPLNHFTRITNLVTTVPSIVYTVPIDRAGIVITAMATNLTDSPQTVTASLSTNKPTGSNAGSRFDIVKNFQVPPNDTTNLVINKLVLGEYDSFIISSTNSNAVNLTLSVLESVNIK